MSEKIYDQFALVIVSSDKDSRKVAEQVVTAVSAPSSKKNSIKLVISQESEAETLFDKEHSTGKQALAIIFVFPEQGKGLNVSLIKNIFHRASLIKVVFLVHQNNEAYFESQLPHYALVGVDYIVLLPEYDHIIKFLSDISRAGSLRRRQRTALRESAGTISDMAMGQDAIQYQHYETQERYLRAILPTMNLAVVAVDSKGNIEIWNKQAVEYFGIGARDALGSNISAISTDSWRATHNHLEEEMKKSHVSTLRFKDQLLRLKPDDEFYADIYYSELTGSDGQKIGTLYLIQDVTLIREVDKAKTEFVSLASHQLRTPTSTINWYAETLLKEKITGRLTSRQKDYVQQIRASSRKMNMLVNSLLDVSRLEMGTFAIEPRKLSLRKLFTDIIRSFSDEADKKKIIITQSIATGLPKFVSWDPNLVEIMIGNLLSNAIKYTPNGGRVAIEVKKYNDAKEADAVIVSVNDNGYGIPQKQQEKIFSKLFRAENVRSRDTDGTGLGLYLVKMIAEHIGTRVWFESPAVYKSLDLEVKKSLISKENKERTGTSFYVIISLDDMKLKQSSKRIGGA